MGPLYQGWPRHWQGRRSCKDRKTQGQRDILPSLSCHLDCLFPKPLPASVSLSPLMSAMPAWTPDHPGGVQPSLVTPAAPAGMADVPWEGTLRSTQCLASSCVSTHRNTAPVPVCSCGREEGGHGQGPPAGSSALATLAWPSPSPSGQWGACSLPGQEDE